MWGWGSLGKEQCVCQAHLSYFLNFIAKETEAHSISQNPHSWGLPI